MSRSAFCALSGASGKMRTIMAAFDREAADDDQGSYAQRRGADRADADGAVAHALRGPGQAGAAGAARGRGPRGGGAAGPPAGLLGGPGRGGDRGGADAAGRPRPAVRLVDARPPGRLPGRGEGDRHAAQPRRRDPAAGGPAMAAGGDLVRRPRRPRLRAKKGAIERLYTGGFYAKCDRCGVRSGRAGRGRQVLLEYLPGRAVAEAAARRVVEPVGEPAEVGSRERLGRALARQEAPGAAVQVLDAALLPRAVRVAEVARQGEVAVESGVGGELGPAVEGDRPAGVLGQPPERVGDAGDHRRRALVLVRQQEGEAARALHQRGHVGFAGLLAKDQQVGLPVAEGLPVADLRRPVLDPALARDRRAPRPSAVAAPAPAARLRQVAVEAVLPALRPVDVAVDRLVADRRPAVRLTSETPRDLLRRPAGLQALGHVRAQPLVGGQLATSLPASAGQVDGLIANDKFCLVRRTRLRLSWSRLSLRDRFVRASPASAEALLTGGTDAMPVDRTSDDAAGSGRPTPLGPGLPGGADLDGGSGRRACRRVARSRRAGGWP